MSRSFSSDGGDDGADDGVSDAMIGMALKDLETPRAVPDHVRARILDRAFSEGPSRDSMAGRGGADDPIDEGDPDEPAQTVPTDPEGRPGRRPIWLVAAAAGLVILVGGAVLAVSDEPQLVVTEPGLTASSVPTSTSTTVTTAEVDSTAVRAACSGFDSSAFAPRTRGETTGPAQRAVLATYDEAATAADQVHQALLVLRDDLRAAGIDDAGVERELSNAIVAMEQLGDPVQNSGVRVDRVWGALSEVELGLVGLEKRMIELGHTSCP